MSSSRKLLASVLFATALPIVVFIVGMLSMSWGLFGVPPILAAPAEALSHWIQSLCSDPSSGSFVCPQGQGAYHRLSVLSFFVVYFVIGIALSCAFLILRRRRTVVPT